MSPQPMTASSGSSHDEGDSNPRSSHEEGDANPRSSHDEGNTNSRSSRANPRSSHDEGNSNSRSSHDKGDANSRSSHAKPRSSHDEGDANPRSSHNKGGKSDKEEYTALEKHVAFFDRNGDGIIYPWETYLGFRALGVGRLGSAIAGLLINMGLSKKTRPGKSFSPLFPIEVKNIRFGIHGSDTDAYDKDGRFVESKFEEIFKKHARKYRNALTYKEIKQLLKTNREPKDLEGWISAFAEWKILHQLYKDKNGLVTEEQIRGVYDGSLFKQVEKERLSSSRDKKSNK